MDRIDNIDLREALEAIARNNTFLHLYNDLGVSISQMEHASNLNDLMEKTMLWVSYPSGIDCYSEREVFQQGTRGYNGTLYHGSSSSDDRRLAYAVDVTKINDGRVFGRLFEVNIKEYAVKVRDNAMPSNSVRIYPDDLNGRQITVPKDEFDRRYPFDFTKIAYWRREPDDHAALVRIMNDMSNTRRSGPYRTCDLWTHVNRLYDDRYTFYSDKIMRDISKICEPNSTDRHFFISALDCRIAAAFNPEQLSRLLDALPYRNAEFSIKKGDRYMQVIIPCDEVRIERQKQQGKPVTHNKDVNEISDTPGAKQELSKKPSIIDALKHKAEKPQRQPEQQKINKKFKEEEI